jgi:DNA uptake protein ComE-like DNA-binding protein
MGLALVGGMASRSALQTAVGVLLITAGCTGADDMGSWGGGGKADGFDDFMQGVYCEPDTGVCIVEGDIPLAGPEAVRKYYYSRNAAPGGLNVFREDDVDHLWNKLDRFRLTYCVSSTEFTADEHRRVVEAMQAAAAEWQQFAHVAFRYVPEQDRTCKLGTNRVTFAVVKAPPDAYYIARAFFPQYELAERGIRMNLPEMEALVEQYPEASLVGIMRHELGHVLGFRHEHIRPENSNNWFCREPETFRASTVYDKKSTMHYPHCDGEGDWSLSMSELDAVGAAFFYPNFERYRGERCPGAELRADGTVDPSCAPVVHEMLELANTASFDVLDNRARLDRRAAETIVAMRATRPFTSLQALDDVPYIGPVSVRRIYDYLYTHGRCAIETDVNGLVDARCRPVNHRILELANTASHELLDHVVGLDSRAATNIVAQRASRPFSSLVELWAVPYVKATALKKLYGYLY